MRLTLHNEVNGTCVSLNVDPGKALSSHQIAKARRSLMRKSLVPREAPLGEIGDSYWSDGRKARVVNDEHGIRIYADDCREQRRRDIFDRRQQQAKDAEDACTTTRQ